MEKDNIITDVIFRVDSSKDFKGTVFALFPYEIVDNNFNVLSYQHIGQHSSADYQFCIRNSRPATEIEYKALKSELEGIGYNLNLIKKINRNKFNTAIKYYLKCL
jgi:hypothetical protein